MLKRISKSANCGPSDKAVKSHSRDELRNRLNEFIFSKNDDCSEYERMQMLIDSLSDRYGNSVFPKISDSKTRKRLRKFYYRVKLNKLVHFSKSKYNDAKEFYTSVKRDFDNWRAKLYEKNGYDVVLICWQVYWLIISNLLNWGPEIF